MTGCEFDPLWGSNRWGIWPSKRQHSGEFDQNFSKKSNAPGFARGGGGRFWDWPVHKSQSKWIADCEKYGNLIKCDIKVIYSAFLLYKRNPKFWTFQFKLLHRKITTNDYLLLIGYFFEVTDLTTVVAFNASFVMLSLCRRRNSFFFLQVFRKRTITAIKPWTCGVIKILARKPS